MSRTPKGARRASLVFAALIIVWAGQTEGAGPYSKKTAHLTWEHMMYWLPASATKSGAVEKVRHKVNKLPAGWGEWVQKEKLKPGVKLPAVHRFLLSDHLDDLAFVAPLPIYLNEEFIP